MSIENLIISISGENRKSFDVSLNQKLVNPTFKLLKDTKEVPIRVVSNSLYPSDTNFTVLAGLFSAEELQTIIDSLSADEKLQYALNPSLARYIYESKHLFDYSTEENLNEYVLKISSEGKEFIKTFTIKTAPAMILPKLEAFGSRLLKLSFPYPVKNWDLSDDFKADDTDYHALKGFYLKLFNDDTNRSNSQIPSWAGYLVTATGNKDDEKLKAPYSIDVSDDLRTVLIQATAKSLPIGEHILQVATSKNSTLIGKDLLRDFHSEKGREIPVSEIPFTSTGGEFAAKATSLEILDHSKVLVTFDNPVCVPFPNKLSLNQEIGTAEITTLSNVLTYAKYVFRVPHTLNKLIFDFNPIDDVSTTDKKEIAFFKPGILSFTLDFIKDSFGLDTAVKTFEKEVIAIKPTLVSVVQEKVPNKTVLEVTFSAPMNILDAQNLENYVLTSANSKEPIPLLKALHVPTSNQLKFTLETLKELPSGMYTLKVSKVKDAFGTEMIPGEKTFSIEDMSVPEVTKILGTSNNPDSNASILIKFNEEMTVNSVHGIDNLKNFKSREITLEKAVSKVFMDNTWVRINFNTNFNLVAKTPPSNPGTAIEIGHIDLKEVFYVTNKSGNILPFCKPPEVDVLVEPLNISNSKVSITSKNEITLILTNDNDYFDPYKFELNDFLLKVSDTETISPIDYSLSEDFKTLILGFNKEFTSLDEKMTISTRLNPTTEDILNRPLVPNVTTTTISNNLRPTLLSASTINISSDATGVKEVIEVALTFSSKISYLVPEEFTAVTGKGETLKIDEDASKALNTLPSSTIRLVFWAFNPSYPITTDVKISSLPENFLSTNSNGKRILPFMDKETVELYAQNLTVNLKKSIASPDSYALKDGEITIEFNKPLDSSFVETSLTTGKLTGSTSSLELKGLQLLFNIPKTAPADKTNIPYSMSLVNSNTLKYTIGDTDATIVSEGVQFVKANPVDLVIRALDGSILNTFLQLKYFFN